MRIVNSKYLPYNSVHSVELLANLANKGLGLSAVNSTFGIALKNSASFSDPLNQTAHMDVFCVARAAAENDEGILIVDCLAIAIPASWVGFY